MSDYYCTGGCRPMPPQPQQQVQAATQTVENCPCRASMVQALQMLLRSGLAGLIDFQSFGFITENFQVGTSLAQPDTTDAVYDNLSDTLAASFSGFTPCACDYVDVAGAVYAPITSPTAEGCFRQLLAAITANADTAGSADLATLVAGLTALQAQVTAGDAANNPALVTAVNAALACPTDTGYTVSRLQLCSIKAIAFEPLGATEEARAANFQNARQLMGQIMRPQGCESACPPYPDPCCDPCNCSDVILCPGRSVSLTAGAFAVVNATAIGNIGQVLVLANPAQNRFYFVCADAADFIR